MIKVFAATVFLLGMVISVYAASMITGSAPAWHGPDWLYSHY